MDIYEPTNTPPPDSEDEDTIKDGKLLRSTCKNESIENIRIVNSNGDCKESENTFFLKSTSISISNVNSPNTDLGAIPNENHETANGRKSSCSSETGRIKKKTGWQSYSGIFRKLK
jgi:hypothetical protein